MTDKTRRHHLTEESKKNKSRLFRLSMWHNGLIKKKAFLFKAIKDYYFYNADFPKWTLSSGAKSQFYFDTRHLLQNWIYWRYAADTVRLTILIDYVNDDKHEAFFNGSIGGLETGAILLSNALTHVMPMHGFYVRKQPKDHGADKLVVSARDLNDREVIIVDDIVTTGGSINQAINGVLKEYPMAKINRVYSLIDRTAEFNPNGTDIINGEIGIKYTPIFLSSEFIKPFYDRRKELGL